MRKTLRAFLVFTVTLLVMITALPSLAETHAFEPQDLTVGALNAGMVMEEVLSSLGKPSDKQTSEEAATGSTLTVLQYDGLTLTCTDGSLTGADWTGNAYTGPRGLKTGDDEQTVISAFRVDGSPTLPGVLYTSGWVDALSAQLPPCGTAVSDESGNLTIRYYAPMEPYGADVQADPASFVYQTHASLFITLDAASQTVTRIQWRMGALAE